jgi:ankyrin repeat protein
LASFLGKIHAHNWNDQFTDVSLSTLSKEPGVCDRQSFTKRPIEKSIGSDIYPASWCELGDEACFKKCRQEFSNFLPALGTIVILRVKSIPGWSLCANRCRARQTDSVSATWYLPRWLYLTSIRVLLTTSCRLSIYLEFPKVISPDCDFLKAIRAGDLEHIKAILHAGQATVADVAAPFGFTPLSLAAAYGHQEVCEFLIHQGALLNSPRDTWIPTEILDYFREHSLCTSSISVRDVIQDLLRLSSTALRMKSILQCVSKWNDVFGVFPRLHKSVLRLTMESAEEILPAYQAGVDEFDGTNHAALHWATYLRDIKTMKILLRFGADPNIGDGDQATPLHIAASTGFHAGIKLLLAFEAKIDSRDGIGATPLYHAAADGQTDALRLLLDAGADSCARTTLGESPTSYATYAEQAEIIQLLRNGGCPLENADDLGFTPILDATYMDCHSLLSEFPFSEVSNTVRLRDGKTLLHIAASNSNLRTIEILQDSRLEGVEAYATDNAGFTAMDYLCKRRDFEDIYEPFCALLVSISPREPERLEDGVVPMEEVFFDALECINGDDTREPEKRLERMKQI